MSKKESEEISETTNIVLYSNGCPKCLILEKAMKDKGISYTKETDMDVIMEVANKHNHRSMPFCEIDDVLYNYNMMTDIAMVRT